MSASLDAIADRFAWMAWTWQTALFFCCIAVALAILLTLAVVRPETPRIGILRFATTRGDRFFVWLLATAFIFLGFLKAGDGNVLYPVLTALALAVLLFRFA